MSETIYHRYRLKRRTTAGWAANNEVLLAGEPGIEVLVDGTEKIKYGDGVKTWSQLSYAAGDGDGASLSNATPQALGTAAAGSSAEASRADHRHQMPTAGQVGADATGTAAAAVAAHAAAADPHPGYALESDARLSDARTPTAHKSTHATGGTDALTPADIGAATAAQGTKADSAVQPAGLTKAAVGLGNVDNTSDADKPVSTAAAAALGGKVGTGAIGSSGLTMATARLLGRTTAGPGAVEEIQVSGGTFANGVLTISGLPSSLTADANGNLTFTGRWIQSTNGAVSAPPMALTGTWFSGGLPSTTKPQFLIEPAGTTSNNWSTAGTGLGVNAPSGFTGNLLDLQVNGTRNLTIASGGIVTIGNLNVYPNGPGLYLNGSGFNYFAIGPSGQMTLRGDSGALAFTATSSALNAADTFFVRDAPGILAHRNDTNAQASRIYNTWTSATNFERLNIRWTSNQAIIDTEAGSGGGTLRGLRIGSAATSLLGFYTATPVAQPAAVADATDAASGITQLNLALARLRTLGLIAT